jgi:hypothetical protein
MSGGLRRRYPSWNKDGTPSQRDMHGILDDIDHQLRDLHRRVGTGAAAVAGGTTVVYRTTGGGGAITTPIHFGLVEKELVAGQADYELGFIPMPQLRLAWVRGVLIREGDDKDYSVAGATLTLLGEWVPVSQAGETEPDLGHLVFLGIRPAMGGF